MATVLCPDCTRKIIIGPKPKKGQMISCPHCDAYLEIVSTSPLELDWPEYDEDFEQEDWDNDDDYDDWDFDDDDEDEDDDSLDWDEDEDDF